MSEIEEQTEAPERPANKPRRQRHIGFATVFSLSVAGIVIFVLALALSERTVPVPDFVRANLEDRINARMDGTPLELGPMEVGVSRQGIPQILMNNIRMADTFGSAVAELNWLGAELSLERLVKGEFAATSVFL